MKAPTFSRVTTRVLASLLAFTSALSPPLLTAADSPTRADHDPASLLDLSLEQLTNLSVTSVSKKEQKLYDVAAAVSVLSNDDLRRSGATTIMEALRLVPGMNVGAVNSSQWSISARGFSDLYANKLLVMIDGRAVYNTAFSGVFWDLQQTMLDDVDRIEVIRGPGATLWGANAVNGVINVVTRSARDTQGSLLHGGGGNVHQAFGGARYGGRIGANTFYRVFGGYFLNNDYPLANGRPAGDGWQGRNAGFRLDHYPDASSHLTWQADLALSNLDDHTSDAHNFNTVTRWDRAFSGRSGVQIQAYYDRTHRNEAARARGTADTVDLTAQHTFALGERNNAIWGVGYRFSSTRSSQTSPLVQIRDAVSELQLFNVFAQNELTLVPDKLTLTGGVKVEHNDFTGLEFQPSLRLAFKPTERQTWWAAVSRAVRTPSLLEGRDVFAVTTDAPIVGPGGALFVPTLVGNSAARSEELLAYEAGFRIQPTPRINLDIAGFYNEYRDILDFGSAITFVPGAPAGQAEFQFENNVRAETYGGEAALTYSLKDNWRLTAGYALLLTSAHGPASASPEDTERGSPQHQFTLRSAYDFSKRASLDAQLRYVDSLAGATAYLTADLRFSFQLTDRLGLSVVGQNLFDNQHGEQGPAILATQSEVPRGVYGKLTYRF